MAGTITRDNLFPPAKPSPKTRADITDHAAREIIKAEADSREANKLRLRQARLQMEAQQSKTASTAKRTVKKAKGTSTRRAR